MLLVLERETTQEKRLRQLLWCGLHSPDTQTRQGMFSACMCRPVKEICAIGLFLVRIFEENFMLDVQVLETNSLVHSSKGGIGFYSPT